MCTSKEKKDICSHRHAFFLDNFIRKILQNPKRIVGEYIKPGDTIIDLGCGPGYFSIEMAKMTEESGKVYSVDLQKEMLEITRKKAAKHHLENQIISHQCSKNSIGLSENIKADFILAFYMVHETSDPLKFLNQVKMLLKKNGKCLIVEPLFHVSKKQFNKMTADIKNIGFTLLGTPPKKGGRSLLIAK